MEFVSFVNCLIKKKSFIFIDLTILYQMRKVERIPKDMEGEVLELCLVFTWTE